MEIRNFDFNSLPSYNRQCICYKKDGNTVRRRRVVLYSCVDIMQKYVADSSIYEGLYMELYTGDYGNCDYALHTDLGKYTFLLDWFSGWETLENEVPETIGRYLFFKGLDGFKRYLSGLQQNGKWINNSMITCLELHGEYELADTYHQYHNQQLLEREQREKERTAAYLEEKRRKELAIERDKQEKISSAEKELISGHTVDNIDFYGTSIILYLMKKYEIKPPLKTQGWINSSLENICCNTDGSITYRYRKTSKNQKGSNAVFKYITQLHTAVKKQYGM